MLTFIQSVVIQNTNSLLVEHNFIRSHNSIRLMQTVMFMFFVELKHFLQCNQQNILTHSLTEENF